MSIAATVGVPIVTGVPACIHDGFVAIQSLRGVDQTYLLYVLKSLQEEMRSAGQTGSQANVNTGIVNGLQLLTPPLEEQKAIAAALHNSDCLIATLKRLVAKKQAIKQGMMQQLLTGETRLPGFDQPWLTVRLRDAGATYGGLSGKAKDDFGSGSSRFVTFMEVIEGARLTGRRLEMVRVRTIESQNCVARGDVLFNGSSETPEDVALSAVVDFEPSAKTYLNSFCFGYRLKRRDLIDPTYLAYFFRSGSGRALVSSLAQGATRYNIAKTKFLELRPVVPTPDEQRAMVDVFKSAEVEIAALCARLVKAKAVKQGMMQELLTGRTRLPVDDGAA